VSDEEGFNKFWAAYPRKVGKGDARRAWSQTLKIRPPIDKVLRAVYAARASKQWQKDLGDFIPHPATWLRGERWDDEMEVDLSQLRSESGRMCAYCGKPSVGSVGGIWHCYEHSKNAMDGEKTNVVRLNSTLVDKKLQSCGS
jgi:ribosomal protein L37AE/L43A